MQPAASLQQPAAFPPPGITALPGGPWRERSILRRRAVKMRLLGQPLCRSHRRIHLKSILNRVEWHKCFVYKQVRFVDGLVDPELEVEIEPRANSRAICSGCGEKRSGYGRLSPRRFQFVPLWNIAVFFVYAIRRVDCTTCGVTVERVPWGEGKEHLTTSYRWFLARWAKRLSWKETADAFSTTWDNVFRSVKHAVEWGLAHRDLSGIEAIGVDEIQWRSGHTYLTLVYQIHGAKGLLWVAQDQTEQSLRGFFTSLTA
jgi:hypothetical protein